MTNDLTQLISIRAADEQDQYFIYATWLRGLYYGNPFYREIPGSIYFDHYKKILKYILLNRGEVLIQIAALIEDPFVILGYSVSEKDRLHWIFVKKQWRKMGIATALLPTGIRSCSHLTKLGKALKPKEWEFNPFL